MSRQPPTQYSKRTAISCINKTQTALNNSINACTAAIDTLGNFAVSSGARPAIRRELNILMNKLLKRPVKQLVSN